MLVSPDLKLECVEADRRRRNALTLRGEAAVSQDWLSRGEVKVADRPLRQSFILTEGQALAGECGMTTAGLGLARGGTIGMVQAFEDPGEVDAVAGWFQKLWNDAQDGTDGCFARQLAEFAAPLTPAVVYRRVLASLFADMTVESSGDLPDRALGLEDSRVWKMLYRFQRDGVLGAIGKLRQWGGCIIADSVGLGKTFEALAVIRYFELRNERVLVLAPKRLRDNWTLWTRNDVRNPLAGDRFAFDVLNHTDLSREGGLSGDIDLNHINWGNYGLVVIDESHNFRNRPTGREGQSRYDCPSSEHLAQLAA